MFCDSVSTLTFVFAESSVIVPAHFPYDSLNFCFTIFTIFVVQLELIDHEAKSAQIGLGLSFTIIHLSYMACAIMVGVGINVVSYFLSHR